MNSSRAANGGCQTSLRSWGLPTTACETGRFTGKIVHDEFSREDRGLFGPTARNDARYKSSRPIL